MTKILIVDDHELVRRGLKVILAEALPNLRIGEAGDGRQAIEAVRREHWDAALLDINMPGQGGLEILEELKRLRPRMAIVVVSAFAEHDYAVRSFKLGAAGFVSKQSASDEVVVAMKKALAGGRYITPMLAEKLAATLAGDSPAAPHELLSNRELQVLRMIASGSTIKEIAAELSLSEKTIGTYRSRISEKMKLGTVVELTRYALKHQLVS